MSETAEIAKLRAALAASEARAEAANSALLQIRATVSCAEAMIKELKLEIAALLFDLLCRRRSVGRFLHVLLALLESSCLLSFGLDPLVVIVRGGHVKSVDAPILRRMLGAPFVLTTFVFDRVTFLSDLPLWAARLCLTLLLAFLATLLTRRTIGFVLIEGDFLGEVTKLLLDLLKRSGEGHYLGILLICV